MNTRPSANAERSYFIKVPLCFIRTCKSYHNSLRRDSSTNDTSRASANFDVLPYVRGVSERISRVLPNNGVKVGYKPFNILCTCFSRPKEKPCALQCRGVVYKVGYVDCNFVYYGQTDRALETKLKKNIKWLFGLETTISKLRNARTNLSIV